MTMQTDVKSTRLTADGQAVAYRTRVKTVYGLAGASAGSVKFYNGTDNTGDLLLDVDTPAGTANTFLLPERQGSGFLQQGQPRQAGVESTAARGRQQARLFLCKDDWDEEKAHIREDSQRPKQSDQ